MGHIKIIVERTEEDGTRHTLTHRLLLPEQYRRETAYQAEEVFKEMWRQVTEAGSRE